MNKFNNKQAIGSVFEFEGIKLEVVENPFAQCSRCYFSRGLFVLCDTGEVDCTSSERFDNNSVIFREVE